MFRNTLFAVALLSITYLTGCAVLDKIAPPQYDEQGQAIPASRQPTEVTQAVADTIPYGTVALNILLLAVAGVEKFKSYKMEKGLKATLMAGKQASKDPELAKLWEKVKDAYYKPAHQSAGVTSLIKLLLAKM